MRLIVAAAALAALVLLAFGVGSASAQPTCEPPVISGEARVGGQLSGAPGACDGFVSTSATLQWFRCTGDTPESCQQPLTEPVSDSAVYPPVAADAGRRLMLQQIGRDLLPGADVDRVLTGPVEGPPVAAFSVAPARAVAGQSVAFTSTSSDPDGDPLAHGWDLDGDGQFDDGDQPTASRVFGSPGAFPVALRVSAGGEESTAFTTVTVEPATAPAARRRSSRSGPRLMSPFPVVTIAGRLSDHGALLTLLRVRAPRGSTVAVRCRGRGCPRRSWRRRVRSGAVRVRRFERSLRAGTVLELRVTRTGQIGKYTRFRIRRSAPPARTDRCLRPGSARPVRCPRS